MMEEENVPLKRLARLPSALIGALILAFALAGAAGAQTVDWAKVVAAAEAGGTVTVYHNFPPPGDEPVVAAFRKAFPKIQVETVRLGSAAMNQRFSTEAAAGASQADVVITLWDDVFDKWIANGWLREWSPPEAAAFPPETRYKDRIYSIELMRAVVAYNSAKVKADAAPKDWAELFDPKWKDKIGMDPPWRSVAVQEMVALWEDRIGIKDSAKRLKENGVRFFSGSAGVIQALVRGDILVAGVIDPPVATAIADGAPVKATFPASGVPAIAIVAMVPQKAPHPEAGMTFVNWAMSVDGQNALQEGVGSPGTRPGIKPPKYVPPNSALNILDTKALLTPERQKAIIQQYRDVFGVQ